MTSYFNRECGVFEIRHNGIKIDVTKTHVDATLLVEFYEKLIGPRRRVSVDKPQDDGKGHIHYIRMLANEIYIEKNDDQWGPISWNDCLKIALSLHRAKLKDCHMILH